MGGQRRHRLGRCFCRSEGSGRQRCGWLGVMVGLVAVQAFFSLWALGVMKILWFEDWRASQLTESLFLFLTVTGFVIVHGQTQDYSILIANRTRRHGTARCRPASTSDSVQPTGAAPFSSMSDHHDNA